MPDLIGTLERHGLAPVAARAAATLGAELRARTAREGREFAAMLDADGGALVGGVVAGEAERVSIEDHLRLLAPGRRYVQLHTHPTGASFSLQDAVLLASVPALRTMIAVGVDGAWYALSKGRRAAPAPAEVVAAYEAARTARDLRREARALLRRGLTERQVRAALSHPIWQRAAPRLGLRYARPVGREGTDDGDTADGAPEPRRDG